MTDFAAIMLADSFNYSENEYICVPVYIYVCVCMCVCVSRVKSISYLVALTCLVDTALVITLVFVLTLSVAKWKVVFLRHHSGFASP